MLLGSAASFIKLVPASKSELIMIPASTRPRVFSPLARRLTQNTSATVKRLMPKADTVICALERPKNMARAAPKPAPALAPSTSGAAIGFWNTPW